jgi:hypothetical protein
MNLKKMLLLAGMALVAIAFAAPAAQAHGLLEEGIPIEDTSSVTLTSTNLNTETALGTLTCEKVTLHYHVEHEGNNGEHVSLEPTPAATENGAFEGCNLNGTTPIHYSGGTHTLTLDTWGHGETQTTLKTVITHPLFGTINCTYAGKLTAQATNETDVVHVGPSALAGNCGAATISGSFTTETPDGTPLEADIAETG